MRRIQGSNLLELALIGFRNQRITVLPILQPVYFTLFRTGQSSGYNSSRMEPIKDKPTLQDYQQYIHKIVEERGFTDETVPELFMYLMEEMGEMSKAARQLTKLHCDANSEKFELAHEMTDVFELLLDLANYFDIDLEQAFREKEAINNTRVWKKKGEL